MLEHKMLLIVEDDEMQRRQISRMLTAKGYNVSEASTGDEAILMLKERAVHLVLTDRKMPGTDGDSLLNHIRTNYPQIRVAIITAYPEGMEDLNPDALLLKPFSGDQLMKLVSHLTESPSA